MTAVAEMNVEEMEMTGFGFEEEAFEGNESMEATEIAVEVKNNNDLYKGIGIGFAAGALLGVSAWFYERKTRLDMLKQLELTTFIAAGLAEGKDVITYNKKEVQLSKDMMNNPDGLIMTIKNNLDNVRMSKKEKQQWKNIMQNLIELTVVWDRKAAIEAAKQKELSKEEVTETLVEN